MTRKYAFHEIDDCRCLSIWYLYHLEELAGVIYDYKKELIEESK